MFFVVGNSWQDIHMKLIGIVYNPTTPAFLQPFCIYFIFLEPVADPDYDAVIAAKSAALAALSREIAEALAELER